MKRLRWRLARWIAPDPIMADPFPGATFVIHREDGHSVAWALETFDISVDNSLDPRRFNPNEPALWGGSRKLTFTGTAGR